MWNWEIVKCVKYANDVKYVKYVKYVIYVNFKMWNV